MGFHADPKSQIPKPKAASRGAAKANPKDQRNPKSQSSLTDPNEEQKPNPKETLANPRSQIPKSNPNVTASKSQIPNPNASDPKLGAGISIAQYSSICQ